ncbi:MAG TPA: tetratricopeptide repeat protein [Chloroflexota bacterium]
MAKIGRNAPCPCGSGKKYKQCCGQGTGAAPLERPVVAEATSRGMVDRRAMERTMAGVTRLLAEHDFSSLEEANALLQQALVGGRAPHPEPRSALEASADCADAYVLLAEETAQTLDLYAKGVAAGERALGAAAFIEGVGHFWGTVETRPYMRARLGLAQCLWATGQRAEAIAHYQELLRLNPGDNQGVRYVLLPCLLEVGEHAGAKALLEQYPDDAMAAWAYARALLTFQEQGDSPLARRQLADAAAANPHVPAYLLGSKRLPAQPPASYGIGDAAEAVVCATEQTGAWRQTPGALAWLAASGPRALQALRPARRR